MAKKNEINVREKISDFFYSDTPAATVTKFILAGAALSSFVFIGAAVPGILKIIDSFGSSGNHSKAERSKKYSPAQLKSAFYRLKKRKLIKVIKEKNGKTTVRLTNQGKKKVREFSIDAIAVKKPLKWDGLWRVVIFDIPVKYNKAREALREKMKKLGLRQLQESAWIIPYECEDEIIFIAKIFEAEKYIEIMTVKKLLHEKSFRQMFKV